MKILDYPKEIGLFHIENVKHRKEYTKMKFVWMSLINGEIYYVKKNNLFREIKYFIEQYPKHEWVLSDQFEVVGGKGLYRQTKYRDEKAPKFAEKKNKNVIKKIKGKMGVEEALHTLAENVNMPVLNIDTKNFGNYTVEYNKLLIENFPLIMLYLLR